MTLRILVNALADQSATVARTLSVQLPAGSFTDIDQGDVLTWGVKLADGAALPGWLNFDSATRTLSGTPSAAATLQIQVTATDQAGASATDAFALNVTAVNPPESHDHGHGNEGVGNGEDPPPPGHDYDHNDGPGASPGRPGNRGHGKSGNNSNPGNSHGSNSHYDEPSADRRDFEMDQDKKKKSSVLDRSSASKAVGDFDSACGQPAPKSTSVGESKSKDNKDQPVKKSTYLDPWAVSSALTDFHLSGKNPVLGGEACGVSDNTNGMSALLAGQQTKALNPQLGGQANSLKSFQGLKEGFDRLAA